MRTVALPRPRSFDIGSLQRLSSAAPYLLAAVFLLLYLMSYPRVISEEPVFNSPREYIGYLLSERAAQGKGFELDVLHYESLPEDIGRALAPRDAALVDGKVVPQDFAGTMLLHAVLFVISPTLVLISTPVFGVLSAWVTARIGKEFLGTPEVLTLLLALTIPALWINSSYVLMSDSIALFFIMTSTYFFLRYWKRARRWDLVFAGLALSLSILFRYPNFLLGVIPVVALVAGRRISVPDCAAAILAMVPAGLTILAFNTWVYGDPLTTGFHLNSRLITDTVNFKQESLLLFQPGIYWSYLRAYALQIDYRIALVTTGVFGLGLAFAALVALRYRKTHRLLGVWTILTFVILFGYYGGRQSWGLGGPYVNSSLLRYLLPAFSMSAIFVAYGVFVLANRPAARAWPAFLRVAWRRSNGRYFPGLGLAGSAVILAGIVGANMAFTYNGPGGIQHSYRSVEMLELMREEVQAFTEPDAIVITSLYDKALLGLRQTMTLSFLTNNEVPIERGDLLVWQVGPAPERFADVARTIFDAGIPLYLMPKSPGGTSADYPAYARALAVRGLQLELMPEVTSETIYRVQRYNPPPWSPEEYERQGGTSLPDRTNCGEMMMSPSPPAEREYFAYNCTGSGIQPAAEPVWP
jgi:hypothetical protein